MASLEEEVIPVLPGNQDEMATRGLLVWMESRDFQAPREKRVHQETLDPGETKGKMGLLGLRGPLGRLGLGALLATLGKMDPGEHQAQRVPKERLDKTVRRAQRDLQGPRVSLAFLERRGMTGRQASQGSLDRQGPRASRGAWGHGERRAWTVSRGQRGSPASEEPMEPQGCGVPPASRVSKETRW